MAAAAAAAAADCGTAPVGRHGDAGGFGGDGVVGHCSSTELLTAEGCPFAASCVLCVQSVRYYLANHASY